MRFSETNIYIHFTNKKEIVYMCATCAVPRIGEEIRLSGGIFHKVVEVVWVYDEPDHSHQRVNVRVEKTA